MNGFGTSVLILITFTIALVYLMPERLVGILEGLKLWLEEIMAGEWERMTPGEREEARKKIEAEGGPQPRFMN